MDDLNKGIISKLLENKIGKYVIIPFIAIAIVYSVLNHIYRCAHNQNSQLFGGLNICTQCKIVDTLASEVSKHSETLYLDTSKNQKKRITNQTGSSSTKQSNSTVVINAKNAVSGTNNGIVGDVNNYSDSVTQRYLTAKNIDNILTEIPSKSAIIEINGFGQDPESQNFAKEIYQTIESLRYNNINYNMHAIGETSPNSGEFKIVKYGGKYIINICEQNKIKR